MNPLRAASARLAAAGVPSPQVDAEILLAALLDVPRSRLATLDRVPDSVLTAYDGYLGRRIAREPVQHITGTAPFRYLELAVGPGVFIPRPETELLVDAVLPHLRALAEPNVVDLCAGTGALGLAIAGEVPGAKVIAVENSFSAIRWLMRNAAGTDVRVVNGDVGDPELLRALYGQTDVVVSNPPYVPTPTEVDPEVLADPREAVFAGVDGLALIPIVIERAALLLRAGGMVALEHDDTHGSAVPELLTADERFKDVRPHRDLSGRPRYVTASRCHAHS